MFTARYVLHSTFCPHSIFMCFVWISEGLIKVTEVLFKAPRNSHNQLSPLRCQPAQSRYRPNSTRHTAGYVHSAALIKSRSSPGPMSCPDPSVSATVVRPWPTCCWLCRSISVPPTAVRTPDPGPPTPDPAARSHFLYR